MGEIINEIRNTKSNDEIKLAILKFVDTIDTSRKLDENEMIENIDSLATMIYEAWQSMDPSVKKRHTCIISNKEEEQFLIKLNKRHSTNYLKDIVNDIKDNCVRNKPDKNIAMRFGILYNNLNNKFWNKMNFVKNK